MISVNRPEARALRLEDLDHYQKEAVEKVSECLLSSLKDLSRFHEASRPGFHSADPFRSSRLFFISGEPGGGKTTAYLSLREALRGVRQEIPDELKNFKDLSHHSHRLVWLDPLDLEPASETTNFLAAVLVRLEEASGSSEKRGEIRKPGLLETGAKRIEGLQNMRRLQSDVVLAWDGNVAQRAEHLDGDVYAMEVLHVEKAKLNVNARLQEAVEGIVPEERKGEEALFVLPVDDFYLRPDASLSLLRLLRMISIPRLFILILGDLDVVEELFYQQILGKLVDLAGGRVLHELERQKRVLTPRASALSSHALRKLVPLAQRYRLQIMFKLRALDFAPAQLGHLHRHLGEAVDPEMERTLDNLLESIVVNLPRSVLVPTKQKKWPPSNFKAFLCLRDRTEEVKLDDDYTYSGLAILDLPPREVVDLWYSLYAAFSKARREKEITFEELIAIVIQQTQEALAAETYLSVEDQKWCEDAIQGSPNAEKRLFATHVLKVTSQRDLVLSIASPVGKMEIFSHKTWKFGPNRLSEEGESVDLGLAPRPSAWFIVLHDLMALAGEDRLLGKPLPPSPAELGWVVIEKKGIKFTWPLPAWPSFWHLDRFRFAWSRVVTKALGMKKEMNKDSTKLVSWLAFHWTRFATDVLLSNKKELAAKLKGLNELDAAWRELSKEVEALRNASQAEEDFESQKLAHDWACWLETMVSEYSRL